jgi:hypothetical protein
MASIPRIYEMKVVLEDWNARIGVYRKEWDHVRGRHIGVGWCSGTCDDSLSGPKGESLSDVHLMMFT